MDLELGRREFLGVSAAVAAFGESVFASEKESGMKVGVMTQAGGAHLSLYFQSLQKIAEVSEVVLADPDGASEAEARSILGEKLTKTYRSYEEMLTNEKPGMALVSVEGKRGPGAIRLALEAGCPVLAEKPACVEAGDFAPLVDLAASKKLPLMLALANRLNPEVLAAKRLIEEGAIGKIFGVEMHLIQDQTRLKSADYQASWFADKSRAGGGHLTWLGIHWLDLSMYLTGSEIAETKGFTTNIGGEKINVEDSAVVALKYANGALGTMTSGYYLDTGYQSHLKIWGSKGWLAIDAGKEPTLRVYRNDATKSAEGEVQGSRGGHDAYTVFVRAALLASAGKGEAPITGRECLRVLKVLSEVYAGGN